MNNTLRRLVWLVIASALLVGMAQAQESTLPLDLEPITPANAARIQQIATWGRGYINRILFSPDGKTLAVASSRGVWLYDAKNWRAEPTLLNINGGSGFGIVFSPDSLSLATVNWPFWFGYGQSATVWDVKTGQIRYEIGLGTLTSIAYSPNGEILAAGGMMEMFFYWTLRRGN